jgi:hypothetical protein
MFGDSEVSMVFRADLSPERLIGQACPTFPARLVLNSPLESAEEGRCGC